MWLVAISEIMDCIKAKKMKNEKYIMDWLKANLDEERYLHSLGCAKCAVELAEKFNLDKDRAYLAGLLHDSAKCFDKTKMLEIAKIMNLDESECINFKVLHAPVSAYVAKNEFQVDDEEILSSIRWHTLGKLDMNNFEKIIFLADKIEANTRDLDFRNTVMGFFIDESGYQAALNKALLLCYKETIKSLVKRDLKICQVTIDIYNSMLN